MDDTLVLVNFDSNVGVCLSGNSSRLYETGARRVLLYVVIPLSGTDLRLSLLLIDLQRISWPAIKLLLTATHRLIIELSALLLKLIVTDVESVPTKTVITHSHLVASTELAGVIDSILCVKQVVVSTA